MLLVGQSAKAAADDGMFPRVFARLNAQRRPGRGLVIVAVLMTIVLFATMSPTLAGQFNNMVDLAVILIIVPYVYSAVAGRESDRTTGKLPRTTFRTYKWLALVAVAYCLWAVIGGDPDDGRARDGGAARQRAALSVLHPLDGGSREAQRGAARDAASASPAAVATATQ